MIGILVPVKDTTRAKRRLASWMTPGERQALSLTMLEDVLRAAAPCRGPGVRIFVATSDPAALDLGWRWGCELIREAEQRSESRSVDAAAATCAGAGVESLLVIPGDAPLVRPEDIRRILAARPAGPGVVLVPSRDAKGTNGILRTPPDAIPSRFGYDSFRAHQEEASRRALPCRVVHLPRLALDIDDEEDLSAFLARPSRTLTYRLLAGSEVPRRLHAAATPGEFAKKSQRGFPGAGKSA